MPSPQRDTATVTGAITTPPETGDQAAATEVPVHSLGSVADAPQRDVFDLARRFNRIHSQPLQTAELYPSERVGAKRDFWGLLIDEPRFFKFEATVHLVSANAVWYFSDSRSVSPSRLQATAQEFEERILPEAIALFAPGLTMPGKIAIVHGRFPGLAGYFNPSDSLPDDVNRFSNQRVGLFMNRGRSMQDNIGGGRYLGTLAHEFHHLMHWLVDPNEEVWLHEGLAELGVRTLGYHGLPFAPYTQQPGVSLRDWPDVPGESLPNYAAASLFAGYLMERIGESNVSNLLAQQADGESGIQAVLDALLPSTRFEEIYIDWLTANLIGASELPYGYRYSDDTIVVDGVLTEPASFQGAVQQLGAWYLDIIPNEPLDIRFDGDLSTALLPVDPPSGDACWWSNRGDDIDAKLTRPVDLRSISEATLEFWAWWDIEDEWDHGYVVISTDDGSSWEALPGTLTRSHDPLGLRLGPSYSGRSNGWKRERIDLTPFAGNEVLLRFEYITQESLHKSGWCINDITIQTIGSPDSTEAEDDWESDGFHRIAPNGVTQHFFIRLVEGRGDDAVVTPLELDAAGTAAMRVERPTTLIVTAIADKTSQPATFQLTATASTN